MAALFFVRAAASVLCPNSFLGVVGKQRLVKLVSVEEGGVDKRHILPTERVQKTFFKISGRFGIRVCTRTN